MADCFTIGQYQYNISYEGEEPTSDSSELPGESPGSILRLKAINYESLVDYRCDVDMEVIRENRLIPSLEILYDILVDGFTKKDENTVKLNIEYDKKRETKSISHF